MIELLDKAFNLGLGAVIMTKEKAEKMVNELIKKGELRQEEAKKMVQELVSRGEQNRRELRDEIRTAVRETLSEMNVVFKSDIDQLEGEIELLRKSKPTESEIYDIKSELARLKAKLNA